MTYESFDLEQVIFLSFKVEILITTLKDPSFFFSLLVLFSLLLQLIPSICLLLFFNNHNSSFLSFFFYSSSSLFFILSFLSNSLSSKFHIALVSQFPTDVVSKYSGPRWQLHVPITVVVMGLPSFCRTFILMDLGPKFTLPEKVQGTSL